MWQLRRLCVVITAGLLGIGLAAGTARNERRGGARAADPSLLPSLFALNGLPGRDLTALPCGDAPCTLAGVRGSAPDALTESLRPAWTDAWCSAGGVQDTRSVFSNAAPLARLRDLPMALAEIRAAAAGSWSWEGVSSTHDALPSPEARPAPETPQPLLPDAPTALDLRVLLATAALPAGGLIRPLRRRGDRIAGALSERVSTALGLLLVILWGTLRHSLSPSLLHLPPRPTISPE